MKENGLPVFLACALTVTGRFWAGVREHPHMGVSMPGLAIPVTEVCYQSQGTVQELESGSQPQSDGSHRVYLV